MKQLEFTYQTKKQLLHELEILRFKWLSLEDQPYSIRVPKRNEINKEYKRINDLVNNIIPKN